MKNVLNNKKGFTLIELLAVIVILAILVMVAIPAVTKYLTSARTSTYVDNAKAAINAVRNDVIMNGRTGTLIYKIDSGNNGIPAINDLLEKKLKQSSFGKDYIGTSCIKVTNTAGDITGSSTQKEYTTQYSMCLIDNGGNGFALTEESAINEANIGVGTMYVENSNNIQECDCTGTPSTGGNTTGGGSEG